MFASLLLGALPTVIPWITPTPSPPPTIIRIVTSETCNTLHSLTLPIGYVTKHNDAAFASMAVSTQKFLSHLMPGDVPTAADLQAALGNSNGAGTALNGTGTPLSASLSTSPGDDPLLYGPGQILDAARIDAVAQQIFGNIALERQYLKKSLDTYPPGTNPKVDELRAHADNVIALQNALANRYEQFAGTYLDNMGVAGMTFNSQSDLATFKIALRGLLLGDTNGLAGAPNGDPNNGPYGGFRSIQDLALGGSPGQVVSALREQEFEFTSSLISTYNVCHDTHFILRPETPAPSPSP
jgi:hypothetical protein